jgi:GxxExxY protein
MFQLLSAREEGLGKQIVDVAYTIHKILGLGLLESVYEKCFCHELNRRQIPYQRQKEVAIVFNDFKIDDGLRLDIFVDELVIIELKAQENFHPVWEAQMISYLKLSNKRLGFLINFHVPLIKEGIKRIVL